MGAIIAIRMQKYLPADWVPEWEVEPKAEVASDTVTLPETPGWHLPADFDDVVANTPLR